MVPLLISIISSSVKSVNNTQPTKQRLAFRTWQACCSARLPILAECLPSLWDLNFEICISLMLRSSQFWPYTSSHNSWTERVSLCSWEKSRWPVRHWRLLVLLPTSTWWRMQERTLSICVCESTPSMCCASTRCFHALEQIGCRQACVAPLENLRECAHVSLLGQILLSIRCKDTSGTFVSSPSHYLTHVFLLTFLAHDPSPQGKVYTWPISTKERLTHASSPQQEDLINLDFQCQRHCCDALDANKAV